MRKVQPTEIDSDAWMRKMQPEKQLMRYMQMKIGTDTNSAAEICSKEN